MIPSLQRSKLGSQPQIFLGLGNHLFIVFINYDVLASNELSFFLWGVIVCLSFRSLNHLEFSDNDLDVKSFSQVLYFTL